MPNEALFVKRDFNNVIETLAIDYYIQALETKQIVNN